MAYHKHSRKKRYPNPNKPPTNPQSRKHRREGTGGRAGLRARVAAYYANFRNGNNPHFL